MINLYRDVVYRSVLHTYVEQLLKRNSNLLFFLEGMLKRMQSWNNSASVTNSSHWCLISENKEERTT